MLRGSLSISSFDTLSTISIFLFIIATFQWKALSVPCYRSPSDRAKILEGEWVNRSYPPHEKYNNLSCSLEWSKYSCIHQGFLEHAQKARNRAFVPTGCELMMPSLDLDVFQPGRTILFYGDSLIRQMFIALTCLLEEYISEQFIHWPDESKKETWPCHGTKNCVTTGVHSGFENGAVKLQTNTTLKFLWQTKDLTKAHLGSKDIALVESGVGLLQSPDSLLEHPVSVLEKRNIPVIFVTTPPEAFKSEDNSGRYAPQYITGHRGCAREVEPVRSREEHESLDEHPRIKGNLVGVLELANTEKQGDSKVGGGVGQLGDCQHYCMPGPPDIFASAIFTMMKQLASNSSETL